jgi:hypothetical protein
MKIASIGLPALLSEADKVTLFSQQHLSHYDLLFTSLPSLRAELIGFDPEATPQAYSNTTVAHTTLEIRKPQLVSRLAEIEGLVKAGSTLVVLLMSPIPQLRSQKGNNLTDFDSEDAWVWFLKGMSFTLVNGLEAEYSGPPDDDTRKYFEAEKLPYGSSISGGGLVEVLRTPSKIASLAKSVGMARIVGKGKVLYLPYPPCFNPKEPANKVASHQREVFKHIVLKIANSLVDVPAQERPEWAQKYVSLTGAALSVKIEELQTEVNNLQDDIASKNIQLVREYWKQDLIWAHGATLESAVARLFGDIGIIMRPGPAGRADLIGRWGDYLLVVEVKGFTGATQEFAVTQCIGWCYEFEALLNDKEAAVTSVLAEYRKLLEELGCFAEDGTRLPNLRMKGMIVSNTYRDTKLEGRPDLTDQPTQHFSAAIQDKLKLHDLVALTTLQLYGLHEIKSDADALASEMQTLVKGVGRFEPFADWKSFISTRT